MLKKPKYIPKHLAAPPPAARRKRKLRALLGDILFYVSLVAFVLAVFLFCGAGDGGPVSVFGFSAMRVLTGSMGLDIPQGSLIVTQSVDPVTLQIGDDITYFSAPTTTVTHRVVAITENYRDTGARAFTTQGTANDAPDSVPVPAANVLGKVIFHSLALGKVMYFVRRHWLWLLVFAALLTGLVQSLRVVFLESAKERQKPPKIPSETDRSER